MNEMNRTNRTTQIADADAVFIDGTIHIEVTDIAKGPAGSGLAESQTAEQIGRKRDRLDLVGIIEFNIRTFNQNREIK